MNDLGNGKVVMTFPDGQIVEFDTIIEKGVQRFKENRVVSGCFDASLFDLNKIAVMCIQNNIPLVDRVIFWAMLGYSVSGLCSLSFMEKVQVKTYTWKNTESCED